MLLILRVQTYCHQPVSSAVECRLSGAGGTLGRSAGNDLVLDDPGKFISRVHAKISFRAGSYFLEDVGSNPSVINDSPLGKGRELALAHGDRIVVGDYQLEARLEAVQCVPMSIAPAAFNNPALPLFEPPPAIVAPPLAPLLPTAAGSDVASTMTPVVLPDSLASARILDIGPGFEGAPNAGFGTPSHDPLGLNLFGGGAPAPHATPYATPYATPAFGTVAPDKVPPFAAADIELRSPEFAAFSMPLQGARSVNLAIPHDYDPLADFLAPPAALPTLPPAPAPTSASAPLPDRSAEPTPVAAPKPDALIAETTVFGTREPLAPPAVLPLMHRQGSATRDNGAVLPGVAPAPGDADSAVLQALLRGLGLPDLKLKGSAVELAETVGALLREATGGTMDLLMARTLTKKESRVDMTMISVRSNNPLKFFPNPQGALTQLLTNAMAGYLPPVQAMQGAFSDLKVHELAVMAGMRAALAAVLHRFDPVKIEQHLALPTVMDKMLSANRKARMWERFIEVYGVIARDADDDLQRLFGEQFSAAYEDQVERLRQAGS